MPDMDFNEFRNFGSGAFELLRRYLRDIRERDVRRNLRQHLQLSERFEKYVLGDNRFELVAKRTLGIICFRIRGKNELASRLLQRLLDRKKIYIVQSMHGVKIFLRFVICGMDTKVEDVDFLWTEIQNELSEMLVAGRTTNIEWLCQMRKYYTYLLKTRKKAEVIKLK